MGRSDTPGGTGRRDFLKKAATVGGTGLLAANAGCTGGGDGGSGGGGDGGSGGGGDGGSGGGDGDLTELTLTAFPGTPETVVLQQMEQQGVMEEMMSSAGYSIDLRATYEGVPLFASGESDLSFDAGIPEAVHLASEQDLQIEVGARAQTVPAAIAVRSNSQYPLEETGGLAESFEALSETNGRIGVFGWGGGDIPYFDYLVRQETDLQFVEGGDFNVVTPSEQSVAQLVLDGEIAAGSTSPGDGGGAPQMFLDGTLVPLFYTADLYAQRDWGVPMFTTLFFRESTREDNPDAIDTLLSVMEEGTDWFYNNLVDYVTNNEEARETMGMGSVEAAEYGAKWLIGEDVPNQFETDTPKLYREPRLTDNWIAGQEALMGRLVEIDRLPDNWQDVVSLVKI